MKLALVNGSPRGRFSNSAKLLDWLTSEIQGQTKITRVIAADIKHQQASADKIADSDYIVCCFPLYTDLTPGIVKHFFETMEQQKDKFKAKPILYLVHSGFPEVVQSRLLERYCQHFTKLMDMQYMGCIIWGGSEPIRYAPESAFKKKKTAVRNIGVNILTKQPIDPEALKLPRQVESMSKFRAFIFSLVPWAFDLFWNYELKKNNAYDKRFDKPYEPLN